MENASILNMDLEDPRVWDKELKYNVKVVHIWIDHEKLLDRSCSLNPILIDYSYLSFFKALFKIYFWLN